MRPLPPPFPAGAVRDALGLVRLLWSVERDGTDIDRMTVLEEIGRTLVQRLEMGRLRQESLGYRAAVSRSADALEQLAAVAWSADVAEVVRVAQARVKAPPRRREDARDAKRAAMAKRG